MDSRRQRMCSNLGRPRRTCWIVTSLLLLFHFCAAQQQHPEKSHLVLPAHPLQFNLPNYTVHFTVEPSNCSVAPDPQVLPPSRTHFGKPDISPSFFTVTCPNTVTEATINFAENRADKKLVVVGSSTGRKSPVRYPIQVRKSQTTRTRPYVQLTDLHLCSDITDTAVCKNFQIYVEFGDGLVPHLTSISVLDGPETESPPKFTSDCIVYPVQLFENVPVTLVLEASASDHVFVDNGPLIEDASNKFISSVRLLELRPRAKSGTTEDVTVYASKHDRSKLREYTIRISTIDSADPRLNSLSISPGRLDPEFSPSVYSYYARVPSQQPSYTISLTGRDDKNTTCVVGGDATNAIIGGGQVTVHSHPTLYTITVDCTSQDKSHSARYTLVLVFQIGGSTELSYLDVINAKLDRSFKAFDHGPYTAELGMDPKYNRGWVSFVARSNNSRATVTIGDSHCNGVNGVSPWFKVGRGETRQFTISVRTPENPVTEKYKVLVKNGESWYERTILIHKLADWVGWSSFILSAGSAASFLQNMRLMQFISLSHRINGIPDTYDTWSEGFNRWNLQSNVQSDDDKQISNGTFCGDIAASHAAKTRRENTELGFMKSTTPNTKTSFSTPSAEQFRTTRPAKSATTLAAFAEVVEATVDEAADVPEATSRRLHAGYNEADHIEVVQTMNAMYKQRIAIRDYVSSIIMITFMLLGVGGLYAMALWLWLQRAILTKNGWARDMPRVLQPRRFWTFMFDLVLVSYAQAGFGITSCPKYLQHSKFIVLGFIYTTPRSMVWFAVFMLLLFPFGCLACAAWLLYTKQDSVVFSKNLNRYHNKTLEVAKAEYRFLSWLPIISDLLAVEIRDVLPIFSVGKGTETPITFVEENESTDFCNTQMRELSARLSGSDCVTTRYKTEDQHYTMIPGGKQDEKGVRYNARNDELKVSFGGCTYNSDCDLAPVYRKYPDADIGRQTLKTRDPYGVDLEIHMQLQVQHLPSLFQMADLPHHFQFWMPRRNCQGLDLDGWNHLFDLAQRHNFHYYLIDRIAFVAIVGTVVCHAGRSGVATGLLIIFIASVLAAFYTPAAVASGTSKWRAYLEEEAHIRKKEKRVKEVGKQNQNKDESPKEDQNAFLFRSDPIDRFSNDCQQSLGISKACAVSKWESWLRSRYFFVTRECLTGAPGIELTKCLVISLVTICYATLGFNGTVASALASLSACFGLVCLNYHSIVAIVPKFMALACMCMRLLRRCLVWIFEAVCDHTRILARLSQLFKALVLRVTGSVSGAAPFEYLGSASERIRNFKVRRCTVIADEIGLYLPGTLNSPTGPAGLNQALYVSGSLGAHRPNLDDTIPIRLPYRDIYLGKKTEARSVAATVHVVNHGLRFQQSDPKDRDVFTANDDSYLSLYRDPQLLPDWGSVQSDPKISGYAIHYDAKAHSLVIRGPGLRKKIEYHVYSTDTAKVATPRNNSNDSLECEMRQCVCRGVCRTSGSLHVIVPTDSPPSLYDCIEVQSPGGDRFIINPTEVKVNYDPVSNELVLKHRLFIQSDDQSIYNVAWTVADSGVLIDEKATCKELGVLNVKLTKIGIPNLRDPISVQDCDNVIVTVDPKETDAYRVSLPWSRASSSSVLLPFPLPQLRSKISALWQQIAGTELRRDTFDCIVPCTLVQNIPSSGGGLYRVEPNFHETMRVLRAHIHSDEAQRSQLHETEHLATAWYSVMSPTEFCRFWQKRGVDVITTGTLWINPLRHPTDPFIKHQARKINHVLPEFKSTVEELFASRVRHLEAELWNLAQWVRVYEDPDLYEAQLQLERAQMNALGTGLETHARKVENLKRQYKSQIPSLVYPAVVAKHQVSPMANTAAQLRQWQRLLAVWLRAEEDSPLMNQEVDLSPCSSLSTTSARSIADSASLENTLTEIMYLLKDHLNRFENPSDTRASFPMLHYVADSLMVRGSYTNWRPDPIAGHAALVRLWHPKIGGTPDFERSPIWTPCCLKLSSNAVKILLPSKDDAEFRFTNPYYWSQVLGYSIQFDCFEAFQLTKQDPLQIGGETNFMFETMPSQLVCRLVSTPQLRHVGDQNIHLVENGRPRNQVVMRTSEDDSVSSDGSQTSRRSDGETFLLSLGKRMDISEAYNLPSEEVRKCEDEVQAFPLMLRFSEHFAAKWNAVIKSAQMDVPPQEFDDQFGIITSGPISGIVSEIISEITSGITSSESEPPPPRSPRSEVSGPADENLVTYEGGWQNYRYHGAGRLLDSDGNEVYNGEWKDGKRWGHGQVTFRDDHALLWNYEGEFTNDEMSGPGTFTLIDKEELNRLANQSGSSKGHLQLVRFDGIIGPSPSRTQSRHFTEPLDAFDKPHLHPSMLQQLFDESPSTLPLVIDIRRIQSFVDDIIPSVESIDTPSSRQFCYEAAKKEYLPHRSRWTSYEHLDGAKNFKHRFVTGICHFADGAVYQGSYRDGIPEGSGRYTSFDEKVKCEGQWNEGFPHGTAVLTEKQSDGSENAFFGSFVFGKRSGQGIQTIRDNSVYVEGDWSDDSLTDSRDTLIHLQPNEAVRQGIAYYAGPIQKGLPEGRGEISWPDGVVYKGQFTNGMREGHGTMKGNRGLVVVAAPWKKDLPHGKATCVAQKDGGFYAGDIFEGILQGVGQMFNVDCKPLFDGLWVDGQPEGRGIMYCEDGTYEGQFQKGKREGKGTFTFKEPAKDPRVYSGDWKNGLPHGIGTYQIDLGVSNTYKFIDGQLDQSSVSAYKVGSEGKAQASSKQPIVKPADIQQYSSLFYEESKRLDSSLFQRVLHDQVNHPSWSRLVSDVPLRYVGISQALPVPISPTSLEPPTRPMPKAGAVSETMKELTEKLKTRKVSTRSQKQPRLIVNVIRGKNLLLPNGQGTKLRVKVTCGTKTKKTKTLNKTDQNPSWNASLKFTSGFTPTVLLQVWNQDNLVACGQTDWMRCFAPNATVTDLLDLPVFGPNPVTGINEPAGYLSLKFQLDSSPPSSKESSSDESVTKPEEKHESHVCVTIRNGVNLTNMDTFKQMDTYVKMAVGTHTKKTKVQKGTDPHFNEVFYLRYNGEHKLLIEAFDKDRFSADDFIGGAEIDLPLTQFEGPITLYRKAPHSGGFIEAGLLNVVIKTVTTG